MLHEDIMKEVLKLASLGGSSTIPNPLVGAIIVDNQQRIIAQGYHDYLGGPHAEITALSNCKTSTNGSTLYVNLEPCCHEGRTGPCAEAIIKAGIKKVVIGCLDPNPKVKGQGLKILKDHNIEVITDILKDECTYLNRGFFKYISSDYPWLTLKMAVSLDGKIADYKEDSKYLSGPKAQLLVHQLRAQSGAVMVGAKTFLKDESKLNVRLTGSKRQPWRVILDPQLKTLAKYELLSEPSHSVVFYNERIKIETHKLNNVEFRAISSDEESNQLNLKAVMAELKKLEQNYILCEGGSRLAASLMEENLIDEIYWILAPIFFNDNLAVNSLNRISNRSIDSLVKFTPQETYNLGNDTVIHGFTDSGKKYIKKN